MLTRYFDLVVQLVSRSVKTRYKRSFLGVAWTLVNPLLTMGVLTLVFSNIFGFSGKEYALYVLSGLILWNFFAQSTTAAMGDLIWSGGIMSRVFLPKSVFAVSAIGTGLVNLFFAILAYILIALILGTSLKPTMVLLPLPILLMSLFAMGIGLAVSSAVIYFPDVMPTYEILLTAWLYLSPVIYPIDLVPEAVQAWIRLNPFVLFLDLFRDVLLLGELPQGGDVLFALLVSFLTLLVGWWVFTRRAREYAYRV